MDRFWQAVGGAGLGLVTGTLVGLSSSPVVATVVGALSAALGAFLGLRNAEAASTSSDIRLGAFGICCVASIFLGLSVRTHNSATRVFLEQKPSLKEEFEWWKQLPNMTDDQARSLVIYRRLNLLPTGVQAGKDAGPSVASWVLFSGSAQSDCELLSDQRYATEDDRLRAIDQVLQAKPNPVLERLVAVLKSKKTEEWRKAVIAGARVWGGC